MESRGNDVHSCFVFPVISFHSFFLRSNTLEDWNKFLALVKSKGFFGDAVEGTAAHDALLEKAKVREGGATS